MNRAQKEAEVALLREELASAQGVVLTSVKGLSMAEVTDLRRRLHEGGVKYRVVKNTLAKLAIQGSDMEVMNDDFKTETAVAWSSDDAVAPFKITMNFKDDVEKFTIKAGYNAGKRLDEDGVKAMSKLPSLDELRAKILGVIQGVPAKLLSQINAPAQHVVGVLQAKVDEDKKAA